MRKITEYGLPKKYTVYVCEICGERSYDSDKIEICEASHSCDHKNTEMVLEDGQGYELKEICICCGKELGIVYFEDFKNRQKILRKIYKIMQIKRKEEIDGGV